MPFWNQKISAVPQLISKLSHIYSAALRTIKLNYIQQLWKFSQKKFVVVFVYLDLTFYFSYCFWTTFLTIFLKYFLSKPVLHLFSDWTWVFLLAFKRPVTNVLLFLFLCRIRSFCRIWNYRKNSISTDSHFKICMALGSIHKWRHAN